MEIFNLIFFILFIIYIAYFNTDIATWLSHEVEISWNEVNTYFQGYLGARENSKNFYTTIIPMLMVNNHCILCCIVILNQSIGTNYVHS